MILLETSIINLYKSTIKAFPKTTKRQYSTDTVVVEKLDWIPFLGLKTLLIKGLVKNEGRKYNTIMLFKKINYKESEGRKIITIKSSSGKEVFLEQIDAEENDVLVRCNCADFYWRFVHYNKVDKSLYGRDRKKYEALYRPDSANPKKMPGVCKHLLKMTKVIKEANLLFNI
jgi:hypothetical protein